MKTPLRVHQSGLTLLEMLIALVLLSILLVLLFGGLRLASRSWSAGDRYVNQTAQMVAVQEFLRSRISQVFPYRIEPDREPADAVFLGYGAGPHEVRFVAPMPAASARGGLYMLRIGLAQNADGGKDLMLWRTPLNPGTEALRSAADDGGTEAFAPTILVKNVRDVDFSYFGRPAGSSGPPVWHSHWSDPTQAPRLVRMNLTLADGTDWPPLIVAPRINVVVSVG